jgi:hypothetical protein
MLFVASSSRSYPPVEHVLFAKPDPAFAGHAPGYDRLDARLGLRLRVAARHASRWNDGCALVLNRVQVTIAGG